jgi:hypothetical protein
MIGEGSDALDHALRLRADPGVLPLLRARPLPDGVLLLIRIAAGEKEAMHVAQTRTSATSATLGPCAVEYLRQVLFAEEADSHRVLGVRENGGSELTKEHYRWLMHWLHPDRDATGASQSLAQRVNRAWGQVRSGGQQKMPVHTRTRHKGRRNVPASTLRTAPPSASARPGEKASPEPMRRFPVLALGSALVLILAAGIAWQWFYAGPMMEQGAAARGDDPADASDDGGPAASDASTGDANAAVPAHSAATAQRMPLAASASSAVSATNGVVPTAAIMAPPRTESAGNAPSIAPAASASGGSPGAARAIADYSAIPERFAAAYAQGDLSRMMDLFTPDAVDADGRPGALAGEYARLFRGSSWRRIRLYDWSWNVENLRAAGSGAYEAWIARYGREGALHLQGRIEIEAVPVAEAWKIRRIALQETPP